MSKLKVEQTHEGYIITIPSVVVWSDAFLAVVVKMLELYDPEEERAEYHRRLAEAARMPIASTFVPASTTGSDQP